jgi:chemotaxis protein MotB
MITLLMAFFIMLYSMSILNTNRFKEVAASIRNGLGKGNNEQGEMAPGNGNIETSSKVNSGDIPWRTVKKLQKLIDKESLGESVRLRVDERGLVITLVADKYLFTKGQAELSPEAKHKLAGIAATLRDSKNDVRVEGHTCNLPVASTKFPSNWELSTSRATNVVRYLINECKIPSKRLAAAGYADSRPLVPNTNEKNRMMNRRVDIIVLRDSYSDDRGN